MPAIVIEKDLMSLNHALEPIGIPVNTGGVAGAGLALWAKKRSEQWYQGYKAACESEELGKKKYHIHSEHQLTMVSIPTKWHWKDDSELDLIIESLLAFNKGYFEDGPMGHGIDTLYLPALGCGLGNLKWPEIEPRLISALKDTSVRFVFCIASRKRPTGFAECFVGEERSIAKHYFFKGECIFGVRGDYPFKAMSPTGEPKEYKNPLHYLYDFLYTELNTDEVVNTDNPEEFIEIVKPMLIKHIQERGQYFDSGKKLKDLVKEKIVIAKQVQFDTIPEYREQIKALREQDVVSFRYCGFDFESYLSVACDFDKVNSMKPNTLECFTETLGQKGLNLIGLINLGFLAQV